MLGCVITPLALLFLFFQQPITVSRLFFAGEGTMEQNQTKLLIPVLRPLYEWAEPVSWLLVRLTVGLMIIPHGWPKVMAGIGPTAANALAKRGIEPAEPSPSFSLCWKR